MECEHRLTLLFAARAAIHRQSSPPPHAHDGREEKTFVKHMAVQTPSPSLSTLPPARPIHALRPPHYRPSLGMSWNSFCLASTPPLATLRAQAHAQLANHLQRSHIDASALSVLGTRNDLACVYVTIAARHLPPHATGAPKRRPRYSASPAPTQTHDSHRHLLT